MAREGTPSLTRIVDDRGVTRAVQDSFTTLSELTHKSAGWEGMKWWHWLGVCIAGLSLFLTGRRFVFNPASFIPTTFGERLSVLLPIAFVVVFHWVRRLAVNARTRSPYAAALLEWARCGGCGYDLQPLSIEPDGCTVCPECGCAWKRQRFTRRTAAMTSDEAGEHARDQWRSIPPLVLPFEQPNVDDRGQPARIADGYVFVSHPGFGGGRAAGIRRRVMNTSGRVRVHAGLVILVIGLVVLAGCAASSRTFRRSDDALYVGFAGVLLLLVGGGVLALVPPRSRWRRALLGAGICAQCGEAVAGLDVEFDGCVHCTACNAHWRHADIGPLAPAERHCARCDYPLTELPVDAPCPECGRGSAEEVDGRLPPWPGARAECAACATVLPGPARVCPKCCHQEGWVWR